MFDVFGDLIIWRITKKLERQGYRVFLPDDYRLLVEELKSCLEDSRNCPHIVSGGRKISGRKLHRKLKRSVGWVLNNHPLTLLSKLPDWLIEAGRVNKYGVVEVGRLLIEFKIHIARGEPLINFRQALLHSAVSAVSGCPAVVVLLRVAEHIRRAFTQVFLVPQDLDVVLRSRAVVKRGRKVEGARIYTFKKIELVDGELRINRKKPRGLNKPQTDILKTLILELKSQEGFLKEIILTTKRLRKQKKN